VRGVHDENPQLERRCSAPIGIRAPRNPNGPNPWPYYTSLIRDSQ
jgi:hypothetical protein